MFRSTISNSFLMRPSCGFWPPVLTRILFLSFLSIIKSHLFAQLASPTFTSKDVFRTSVFLQNNNIVDSRVSDKILFFTDHDYINAFFTEKGVMYNIAKIYPEPKRKKSGKKKLDRDEEAPLIKTTAIYMKWIGANPHPKIIAEQQEHGYYTYLKRDGKAFKSLMTNGYKSLLYKDLYPGIDVEYSFPEKGGVKYNLIVHPGADVKSVKMSYWGSSSLEKDLRGNVIVHTESGDIIEHAPVCFSDGKTNLPSNFNIKGNILQFDFPEGHDSTHTLIVDPWVTILTNLPPLNMGMDVDYDLVGNLYVYGAGSTRITDNTNFFQVAKYNEIGNHLWTFNGSVPSINWNGSIDNLIFPSNFIVDKETGSVYVGKAFDYLAGTSIIRLNNKGEYDNFISSTNSNFTEIWGFAFNCSAGTTLALGGGITSPLNMGVINTITGETTTSNITGIDSTYYQDIVSGTYDSSGNLYVMMNSSGTQLPFENTIYKVNKNYNGHLWLANSGFSSFREVFNAPYWDSGYLLSGGGYDGPGNWFNALSANGSYLYCYDGHNISAYSLLNGAMAGTPGSISNYDSLYQGGIAVDNCNHVYLGGIGVIKVFTFNDSIFVPEADIPLGAGFENDTIHDVKYNSSSKTLYVTGKNIVGTYLSTLTTNCYKRPPFDFSTYKDCNSISVQVKPDPDLSPKIFTYIWMDSANNIISRLDNTTDTLNTLDYLHSGTYYIQIQWNVNCGGGAATDTIHLGIEVDHVLYCPNAFTPNGDGNNDVYYAYAKAFHDFNLSIFDRWGEKVFETPNINKAWDGTFQGNNSPEGVYSYVVSATFNDGCISKKKGSIALIR